MGGSRIVDGLRGYISEQRGWPQKWGKGERIDTEKDKALQDFISERIRGGET